MVSWNEIPFDSNAEPDVKAQEFDLQYAENKESAQVKEDAKQYPWDLKTGK